MILRKLMLLRKKYIWILLLIGLLVTAPLLAMEGTYRYGLSLIRKTPSPPQQESWPPLIMSAIWASFDEKKPMKVKPIMPWHTLVFLLGKDDFTSGNRIAGFVARRILDEDGYPGRMLIWHLKGSSITIWLSRHWTTEQIIIEAGKRMTIVPGLVGVENASNKMFGKKINDLKISEIALLLAIARSAEISHPEKLLARRNHIIETMFRNGFISEADMQKSISQPIKFRSIGRDRSS